MTDSYPTQSPCNCNLCLRRRQLAPELRDFEAASSTDIPLRLVPRIDVSRPAAAQSL